MREIRFTIVSFLIVLAISTAVLAQQGAPTGAYEPSTELLKKHVTYLASPEMEGRRPGAGGANKAAAYLSEEFYRLRIGCASPGYKCRHTGKERNGYLKEFPLIGAVDLGGNNSLSFAIGKERKTLSVRDQWMPLGFSSNGQAVKGQLVFAGYGITAADLKHDDYANLTAKDKIALVFASTFDRDNAQGQLARYADARWKAIAAKDHGAKALVLIANEEKFSNDRLSKLRYDQTAGEAGIPVAVVSRQIAAGWFGLTGATQLSELEKSPETWASAAKKLSECSIDLSVNVTRLAVPAYNVVGVIEGSDPKLKREFIVVGAHYDHLGRGGENSLAPNSTEIHHGADDNASGTAGLLELARILSAQRNQLRRSVVLIAFSAEESGLIGSKAYINNPAAPIGDTIVMLNMDMIGRLRDDKLMVGGIGTSPEFRKLVEEINTGRFALQLGEDGFGPSDHSSFYAKQVPILFFFTGTHEDYHKPSDTAEKINYEGQAKVVGFVAEILRAIDRKDTRPTYVLTRSQSGTRNTGFRVYLGTVPNYSDTGDGMLLDAVRDGSPAAAAGLKAGDKIVKLAGREIKTVYDYTYALGEMKPDQEYEVEILRSGERLKMKLVPQARK